MTTEKNRAGREQIIRDIETLVLDYQATGSTRGNLHTDAVKTLRTATLNLLQALGKTRKEAWNTAISIARLEIQNATDETVEWAVINFAMVKLNWYI